MTKPILPKTAKAKASSILDGRARASSLRRRARRKAEKSDVLISAVISTYLLTHLHQLLQTAEHGAAQEGMSSKAANFAQLRKVLCMDARSMKDALAAGITEAELDQVRSSQVGSNAA